MQQSQVVPILLAILALSFSGHFATNEKLSQLIFERNLSDIAWALLDEILIIDEKENIVSIMDKHKIQRRTLLSLTNSELGSKYSQDSG